MTRRETRVLDALATRVVRDQTAGVVVQDDTGAIVDFNDAATRLLEMPAEVLSGRSSADPEWEAVDADERPLTPDEHPSMTALRSGISIDGAVLGVRVGGGDYRWLRVDAQPHELDGETLVVAQFTDITAQRAADARMAHALDRLQQHALPELGALADWLEAESRYANVNTPLRIGGDFVDVFDVDHERCGFFIGDVSGHDLDAAATMMLARHTLRAAGLHLQRPGRVLGWLHDTLVSTADTVYCTAIYGDVTPMSEGGLYLRLANGGHPPPIKIDVDGRATSIEEHGSLLGIITPYTPPPTVEVMLAPGERLVLYTDGLAESREPRLEVAQVAELFDARRPRTTADTMVVVDQLMESAHAQQLRAPDDTAVLVLAAPSASGGAVTDG